MLTKNRIHELLSEAEENFATSADALVTFALNDSEIDPFRIWLAGVSETGSVHANAVALVTKLAHEIGATKQGAKLLMAHAAAGAVYDFLIEQAEDAEFAPTEAL